MQVRLQPARVSKQNQVRTAEQLTTVITRSGETLTGVVIDRHVFHLTLQFYHDGEAMGSRNIRYDAISQERAPTVAEAKASGYPQTTLPGGLVVSRPFDARDPASVLSRMRSNQSAIDALETDNQQLIQRYLALVGRSNASEIQRLWLWARNYVSRERADELLAAADNAADYAQRLAAYKEIRPDVGQVGYASTKL